MIDVYVGTALAGSQKQNFYTFPLPPGLNPGSTLHARFDYPANPVLYPIPAPGGGEKSFVPFQIYIFIRFMTARAKRGHSLQVLGVPFLLKPSPAGGEGQRVNKQTKIKNIKKKYIYNRGDAPTGHPKVRPYAPLWTE